MTLGVATACDGLSLEAALICLCDETFQRDDFHAVAKGQIPVQATADVELTHLPAFTAEHQVRFRVESVFDRVQQINSNGTFCSAVPATCCHFTDTNTCCPPFSAMASTT